MSSSSVESASLASGRAPLPTPEVLENALRMCRAGDEKSKLTGAIMAVKIVDAFLCRAPSNAPIVADAPGADNAAAERATILARFVSLVISYVGVPFLERLLKAGPKKPATPTAAGGLPSASSLLRALSGYQLTALDLIAAGLAFAPGVLKRLGMEMKAGWLVTSLLPPCCELADEADRVAVATASADAVAKATSRNDDWISVSLPAGAVAAASAARETESWEHGGPGLAALLRRPLSTLLCFTALVMDAPIAYLPPPSASTPLVSPFPSAREGLSGAAAFKALVQSLALRPPFPAPNDTELAAAARQAHAAAYPVGAGAAAAGMDPSAAAATGSEMAPTPPPILTYLGKISLVFSLAVTTQLAPQKQDAEILSPALAPYRLNSTFSLLAGFLLHLARARCAVLAVAALLYPEGMMQTAARVLAARADMCKDVMLCFTYLAADALSRVLSQPPRWNPDALPLAEARSAASRAARPIIPRGASGSRVAWEEPVELGDITGNALLGEAGVFTGSSSNIASSAPGSSSPVPAFPGQVLAGLRQRAPLPGLFSPAAYGSGGPGERYQPDPCLARWRLGAGSPRPGVGVGGVSVPAWIVPVRVGLAQLCAGRERQASRSLCLALWRVLSELFSSHFILGGGEGAGATEADLSKITPATWLGDAGITSTSRSTSTSASVHKFSLPKLEARSPLASLLLTLTVAAVETHVALSAVAEIDHALLLPVDAAAKAIQSAESRGAAAGESAAGGQTAANREQRSESQEPAVPTPSFTASSSSTSSSAAAATAATAASREALSPSYLCALRALHRDVAANCLTLVTGVILSICDASCADDDDDESVSRAGRQTVIDLSRDADEKEVERLAEVWQRAFQTASTRFWESIERTSQAVPARPVLGAVGALVLPGYVAGTGGWVGMCPSLIAKDLLVSLPRQDIKLAREGESKGKVPTAHSLWVRASTSPGGSRDFLTSVAALRKCAEMANEYLSCVASVCAGTQSLDALSATTVNIEDSWSASAAAVAVAAGALRQDTIGLAAAAVMTDRPPAPLLLERGLVALCADTAVTSVEFGEGTVAGVALALLLDTSWSVPDPAVDSSIDFPSPVRAGSWAALRNEYLSRVGTLRNAVHATLPSVETEAAVRAKQTAQQKKDQTKTSSARGTTAGKLNLPDGFTTLSPDDIAELMAPLGGSAADDESKGPTAMSDGGTAVAAEFGSQGWSLVVSPGRFTASLYDPSGIASRARVTAGASHPLRVIARVLRPRLASLEGLTSIPASHMTAPLLNDLSKVWIPTIREAVDVASSLWDQTERRIKIATMIPSRDGPSNSASGHAAQQQAMLSMGNERMAVLRDEHDKVVVGPWLHTITDMEQIWAVILDGILLRPRMDPVSHATAPSSSASQAAASKPAPPHPAQLALPVLSIEASMDNLCLLAEAQQKLAQACAAQTVALAKAISESVGSKPGRLTTSPMPAFDNDECVGPNVDTLTVLLATALRAAAVSVSLHRLVGLQSQTASSAATADAAVAEAGADASYHVVAKVASAARVALAIGPLTLSRPHCLALVASCNTGRRIELSAAMAAKAVHGSSVSCPYHLSLGCDDEDDANVSPHLAHFACTTPALERELAAATLPVRLNTALIFRALLSLMRAAVSPLAEGIATTAAAPRGDLLVLLTEFLS